MRNYVPKDLQELKKEELEDCPQNDILFDKLLILEEVNRRIKNEMKRKDLSSKEIISLSNTLNGNVKSIIAILNTMLYIEEELDDELDSYFNNK